MLNDARSLWSSASTVVHNIASALTDDTREDNEEEARETLKELEIYKRMLEESQMSLVEVSKASRLAIAEKEAELAVYKFGDIIVDKSKLDHARILAEKTVLADNVKELEQQLVQSMQEKSRVQIKNELYDDLKSQLMKLKSEFAFTIKEMNTQDASRLNTIDNMVAEYSKLASEYESRQIEWNMRQDEIMRENEILVTKIHVLESSMSDMADRDVSYKNIQKGSSISSNLNSGGSSNSISNNGNTDSDMQLKELRSKIINLQYDLKERTEMVSTLKNQLSEAAAKNNQSSINSSKHEDELHSLRSTLEGLKSERRIMLEREEELIVQNSRLSHELTTKESSTAIPSSLGIQTIQGEMARYKEELAAKSIECSNLSLELEVFKSRLNNSSSNERVNELEILVKEKDQDIITLSTKNKDLELRVESLSADILKKDMEFRELINKSESSVGDISKSLLVSEDELMSLRNRIEALNAELEASLQMKSALEEQHDKTVLSLRRELHASATEDMEATMKAAKECMEAEFISREETTKSGLIDKHLLEMKALTTTHATDLEAFRNETAILTETALVSLRQELTGAHSLALTALMQNHQEEITNTLNQLKITLSAEKDEALTVLTAEKNQELSAAMSAAAEELNRRLAEESCKADIIMKELIAKHGIEIDELLESVSALESKLNSAIASIQDSINTAVEEERRKKDLERNEALEALRIEMRGIVEKAETERDAYFALYSKERELRKIIHNKLIELQGNIRVICRTRPVLEVERRAGAGSEVDVTEFQSDDVLTIQRDPQTKTRFEFDRVFSQTSSQEEVFLAVQPLCISVLDGYNVCIFAFGQTGSGKTFTMEGSIDNQGVAPRAVKELFKNIDEQILTQDYEYSVKFSMLEIYNESIRDLLDSSSSGKDKEKLDVRQTSDGVNIVQGLIEEDVDSATRVAELMAVGQSNRAVGSHDMNEHSSRSHSILTLTVRGRNRIDGVSTFGKLHLIDLAGSERLSKTDATGERLKEAQNINRSLSALGDVINALGNKKATHVPYRNSKLTFLLQDSLGGNSKVLMFVNISPAVYNLGETLCSLNFASRCRSVELGQPKKQLDESGSGGKKLPAFISNSNSPVSSSLSPSVSAASLVTPVSIRGRSSLGGTTSSLPKSFK